MRSITFRFATEADLETTYRLFVRATNGLFARHNLPLIAMEGPVPARAMAFRRHALAYDGQRFWVAEDRDKVVGFGIATLRDELWYLAALHVHPAYQGQGIGRRLLERCLPPPHTPVTRLVISDSLNPDSNALYAKHGLYQSMPLLLLRGRPPEDQPEDGPLRAELVTDRSPVSPALDVLDRSVLGAARQQDHALWISQPGQSLWRFHSEAVVAGYAYVSEVGIGPAAASNQSTLVPILSHCLRQLSINGATEAIVKIPASCHAGVDYLLHHGFRYEQLLLIGASRPLERLDRYLVSIGDALF